MILPYILPNIVHINEVLPYEWGIRYNNRFQDVRAISMCIQIASN
jgi:hypothetical protein